MFLHLEILYTTTFTHLSSNSNCFRLQAYLIRNLKISSVFGRDRFNACDSSSCNWHAMKGKTTPLLNSYIDRFLICVERKYQFYSKALVSVIKVHFYNNNTCTPCVFLYDGVNLIAETSIRCNIYMQWVFSPRFFKENLLWFIAL